MGSKALCLNKENAKNCRKPCFVIGIASLPGPYCFIGMAGMPTMYQKQHCIDVVLFTPALSAPKTIIYFFAPTFKKQEIASNPVNNKEHPLC